MHNFIIKPHIGIDDIKFEMSRHVIRDMIGIDGEYYNDFDFYTFMTIFYDDKEICEAIMIQNFSEIEKYNLILENINIFQLSYSEIKKFLSCLDNDIEISDRGIISNKFGIKIKPRENHDFENCTCEYVYLFK